MGKHTHTHTHKQTLRHTETQTHRHTDTQTHRDTDTDRHTDTQTHRHKKPQTLTRNVLFSEPYTRGDKNHLALASCMGKCYRRKEWDTVGRLTLKMSKLLKV